MSVPRISDAIAPDHKLVARMVGTALALTRIEGLRAYRVLSRGLRERLTPSERQGLAWAALKACDADEAQGIAEDLFETQEHAGPPDTFDVEDPAEAAEWWADLASHEELMAYGLAILDRLTPAARGTLLRAAERGRA